MRIFVIYLSLIIFSTIPAMDVRFSESDGKYLHSWYAEIDSNVKHLKAKYGVANLPQTNEESELLYQAYIKDNKTPINSVVNNMIGELEASCKDGDLETIDLCINRLRNSCDYILKIPDKSYTQYLLEDIEDSLWCFLLEMKNLTEKSKGFTLESLHLNYIAENLGKIVDKNGSSDEDVSFFDSYKEIILNREQYHQTEQFKRDYSLVEGEIQEDYNLMLSLFMAYYNN